MSMRRRQSPSFLAGLLVVAILLVHVLAGSVSLHKKLHCDASAPDHECAVSLISHGQIDLIETAIVVTRRDPVAFEVVPLLFLRLERLAYFLLPGRAPPIPLA
jgi:hypothetical protein